MSSELEDKFLEVSKEIMRQVNDVLVQGLGEMHRIAQEELKKNNAQPPI